MSIALEAAAKVHGKQINAAAKSEDLVVRGLHKIGDLLAKSPDVPANVAQPLLKVATPAGKVVGRQVSFANKTQDAMVEALEKRATGESKSVQVPESLAGPLQKVSAPVTKVFGTPKEYAAFSAASARDWVEVRDSFQKAVREALVTPKPVEA
jgi:hypothetical protein